MDDLIEKVARGLCSRESKINPALQDKVWKIYRDDARAAMATVFDAQREWAELNADRATVERLDRMRREALGD